MDCSQSVAFDYVKHEKAKAMARYNRFRKISKVLQFLEVLVAIALISWCSTFLPGVFKVCGEFLFAVVRYLCNPHVVFLIGNGIVAALFFLRRENDSSGNECSGSSGDVYDDYVRHSERSKVYVPDEVESVPPLPTPEVEDLSCAAGVDFDGGGVAEEKQIVCVHSDEKKRDPMAKAIETATKQIEKLQRTQSVKLKREMSEMKQRPAELRRSETVKVGGCRAKGLGMTPVDRLDKLNDEEFKMTIDAYIEWHQQFFKDQKLAENQELKQQDIRKNYICASA